MPSALADRLRVLPLLLLVGLVGCGGNTSIAPPTATADTSTQRSVAAADTIDRLSTAFESRSAGGAAALGEGAGKKLLTEAAANVKALDLVDVSLRFVDDRSSVAGTSGQWLATVEVVYRLAGWDATTTTLETTFVFAPGPGGTQLVAGVGDGDGRTPLWLDGPVKPVISGRTLVLARNGSGVRYSTLARNAVVAVGKVLPSWQGKLVVEVPGSEAELDHALGADQAQYANIAAVTASVDGSLVPSSPVHVFLNPRVFDALGTKGAQVVISHESTHVATKATFATMPTWLLEGFADYVALAHAGVPVKVAASQILARVRREGPPKGLPTAEDLSPTATGLGATYEEAWLANRFIAAQYGEAKLVAFYEAVNDGAKAEAAFSSVLGTTQAAFVKRWSADTRALAKGVAG